MLSMCRHKSIFWSPDAAGASVLSGIADKLSSLSVEQLASPLAQSELENLARGVDLASRIQQAQFTFESLNGTSRSLASLSASQVQSLVDQWQALLSEMRHLEISVRAFALSKKSQLPPLVTSVVLFREKIETAAQQALRPLELRQTELERAASALRGSKIRHENEESDEESEQSSISKKGFGSSLKNSSSAFKNSNAEKLKKKNDRAERLEKRAGLLKELQEQMQQAKSTPSSASGGYEVSFSTVRSRAAAHVRGSVGWASEVVGIDFRDSLEMARSKFRERARQWHPDVRTHTAEQDEAMVWLNEAWEILKRTQK